jgi:hypothetical protein
MQDRDTIPPQARVAACTCPACSQTYPRTSEHWHRNKATKDGLTYLCKACNRAKSAAHHATPRPVVDGVLIDRRRRTDFSAERTRRPLCVVTGSQRCRLT